MTKKLVFVTGAVAAAILSFFSVILLSGCSSMPDNAAATVNGVVITKDAVEYRIHILSAFNPGKVPPQGSDDYKALQAQVAGQLVSEEITNQEAAKRNITVTDEEIESKVDQVVEDSYLGNAQKMQDDFAQRGLTTEDLRTDIRRHIVYQKLLDSLRDEVPVTDQEVQQAYDTAKNNYVSPEKRQVRQLVAADQATAQQLSARIAGGESFTTIAQQNSIDKATAPNGGLVGLVTKDSLPGPVGDVAFSLQQGQLSPPFQANGKWYVVTVELITPAVNKTFDDVKDQLRTNLSNQHLAAHYKDYEQSIHETYDVKFADGYDASTQTTAATDQLPADQLPTGTQPAATP